MRSNAGADTRRVPNWGTGMTEAVSVSGDLSPLEVAVQTGLSRSLIYREIERGNLVAYRIGARLRVEPEAVACWKERCRVRPRMERPIYEPAPRSRGLRFSSGFADELVAIERAAGRRA